MHLTTSTGKSFQQNLFSAPLSTVALAAHQARGGPSTPHDRARRNSSRPYRGQRPSVPDNGDVAVSSGRARKQIGQPDRGQRQRCRRPRLAAVDIAGHSASTFTEILSINRRITCRVHTHCSAKRPSALARPLMPSTFEFLRFVPATLRLQSAAPVPISLKGSQQLTLCLRCSKV